MVKYDDKSRGKIEIQDAKLNFLGMLEKCAFVGFWLFLLS
jgi:hypothetical protein